MLHSEGNDNEITQYVISYNMRIATKDNNVHEKRIQYKACTSRDRTQLLTLPRT